MNRIFVLGDIHGGLRAVKNVLGQIKMRSDDQFIFLGDYVDGWSESAELISFLIDFGHDHDCIFIRGNHDQLCEEWLKTGELDSNWLKYGGQATFDSYATLSDEEKTKHIQFFESLIPYHLDDEKRLFLHAGFTSTHGVEKEWSTTNFYWDRTLWACALLMEGQDIDESEDKYPDQMKHYSEIYIGHTATTKYGIFEPINIYKVWNMDTGAAFKGKLSMMEIHTKKLWQSEQVASLYPDEKGRN